MYHVIFCVPAPQRLESHSTSKRCLGVDIPVPSTVSSMYLQAGTLEHWTVFPTTIVGIFHGGFLRHRFKDFSETAPEAAVYPIAVGQLSQVSLLDILGSNVRSTRAGSKVLRREFISLRSTCFFLWNWRGTLPPVNTW